MDPELPVTGCDCCSQERRNLTKTPYTFLPFLHVQIIGISRAKPNPSQPAMPIINSNTLVNTHAELRIPSCPAIKNNSHTPMCFGESRYDFSTRRQWRHCVHLRLGRRKGSHTSRHRGRLRLLVVQEYCLTLRLHPGSWLMLRLRLLLHLVRRIRNLLDFLDAVHLWLIVSVASISAVPMASQNSPVFIPYRSYLLLGILTGRF